MFWMQREIIFIFCDFKVLQCMYVVLQYYVAITAYLQYEMGTKDVI